MVFTAFIKTSIHFSVKLQAGQN